MRRPFRFLAPAALVAATLLAACDTQQPAPPPNAVELAPQAQAVPVAELHQHASRAEVERRLPELAARGVRLSFDEAAGRWVQAKAVEEPAAEARLRGLYMNVTIYDPGENESTRVIETSSPGSTSLPVDVAFDATGEGTMHTWNERISWSRATSCSRNAATGGWTDLHLRTALYGFEPWGNRVQTSFRPGSYGLYVVEARGWVNLVGVFPFPVLLESRREVGCYSLTQPYVPPTPSISLSYYPNSPTVGSTVELTATVQNAPAPITQYEWGINGQHTFTSSRTKYITYQGQAYVSVTAYFSNGQSVNTSRVIGGY